VTGGVERPGTPTRFDDDRGLARRSDQPVPLKESSPD